MTKALKTLLIHAPSHINRFKPRRACFPLGIAYIAAYLRENGFEVEGLDCVIEGFEDITVIDEKSDMIVYGLYGAKLKERIAGIKPDIIGISCPYYTTQKTSLEIARIAKEAGVKWVTLGGQHASGLPEYFLSFPQIDSILIGEGESSFLELVKVLSSGEKSGLSDIDGFAFRRNGKIVINPKTSYIQDVNSLPYPARDLFPMQKYFAVNTPSGMATYDGMATEFMTSRGCPFNCSFCASTVFNGNYRPRSPKSVLDEIRMLKDKYGVREIQIVDDNMTWDRKRIIEICKGMIENKLDIKWGMPNAVGVFALDEEVIGWLAKSGVYYTHLAIESGDQDVLTQIMKKPTQIDQSTQVAKLLHKYGIDVSLIFCVGHPGETFKSIKATFDYAAKLPGYEAFFYFATPLPGTPLYEQCRANRYIPEDFLEQYYDFQEPIITTPEWTPRELKQFVRKNVLRLHLRYFLRDPLGFLIRYYKRYRKNLSTLKSYFLFAILDKLKPSRSAR